MTTMIDENENAQAGALLAELSAWRTAVETGRFDAPGTGNGIVTIGLLDRGFASSRFVCRFGFRRVSFCAEIPLVAGFRDGEPVPPPPDSIRRALLMALLLVRQELTGADWLPGDALASVRVAVGSNGCGYRILDGRGREVEYEPGWQGLVRRIDAIGCESDCGLDVFIP